MKEIYSNKILKDKIKQKNIIQKNKNKNPN